MSTDVRVRFAPSPTGYLHIGGARTALFNWLFVHHHGGKLVLRIKHTDLKRNTEEAAAAIYQGLEWLGINWDEGPHVGGDLGPYFQSQRTKIYERYLKKLQDGGHIFEDQGALRFRSPREHVIVNDLVCGKIDFDLTNPATHPDMTVRRPDGSWIFHFVNVIDDIEMKISHVIRGEDHLSNTPKHIELYKALGATPPNVAHMSLDRFVELARPFLERAKIDITNDKYTRDVLAIVKEKIKLLKELPEWTSYFFTEDYEFDPAAVEKVFGKPEAAAHLKSLREEFAKIDKWESATLESSLKSLAQKLGCKTGDLVHPARVAVSGRSVGPSLYHMLEVMGKERVLKRFDRMLAKLAAK